jgi:23S rRNA (guanosine2251-2'-O)-methyltransferase
MKGLLRVLTRESKPCVSAPWSSALRWIERSRNIVEIGSEFDVEILQLSSDGFRMTVLCRCAMDKLTGIHAVKEALEAGRAFDRIVIARGRQDTRVEEIVRLARDKNVAVRFEDRGQLDRLAESRDHQGIVGLVAARAAATLEDILAAANAGAGRGEKGLIVLLDGVEDPHNLGAIIRTALAAGAHGVVIPERRAAGLTDTVARASAGALAHLPVAKVTNLGRAMEELKEAGYWLIGLDEDAEKNYTQADFTSPVGIVLGGEGKGLHELTRKRCDFVVSLPTAGPVKSLNVSVAAGVVLFEALRQRRGEDRH